MPFHKRGWVKVFLVISAVKGSAKHCLV